MRKRKTKTATRGESVKKLPIDELLRLACIYAETDREEYQRSIEGAGMEDEKAKTAAFLKQLREYRLKRWGRTSLEAAMDEMKPVPLSEIASRP